jgi:hypothetical protein
MPSGLEMMLRSFGIDPQQIVNDVKGQIEQVKIGVTNTLAEINGRLIAIEETQARIEIMLQEVTAWKRQQKSAEMLALNQPQQQPTAPRQPNI